MWLKDPGHPMSMSEEQHEAVIDSMFEVHCNPIAVSQDNAGRKAGIVTAFNAMCGLRRAASASAQPQRVRASPRAPQPCG